MIPRRVASGALLLSPFLLASAVARGQTAPMVRIDNFTFNPPSVVVTAGETVRWVNAGDIPHTVTATDHSFRSKPLDTDDSYAVTFRTPGEYTYFCSLHPHMTGKVVVRSAS